MATGHEHWHERGEIYALGALDGQELKEFEAHLASGCPICEAYLRETRETLAVLHRSLRPEAPPLAIKARVLDQVAPQGIAATAARKSLVAQLELVRFRYRCRCHCCGRLGVDRQLDAYPR